LLKLMALEGAQFLCRYDLAAEREFQHLADVLA
jgi:hypothetical protein